MSTDGMPFLLSDRASALALCFVRVNTIVLPGVDSNSISTAMRFSEVTFSR